ncbi:MAG TPA: 6-carboxytetrahydropterin synthase [Gemmatimonadales bacterium]|nr:6-carboxytetrahydropterin synthase [Gemmatimonadales bacterium]
MAAERRRGEFRVTVTKEDLVFAAAHFITLPGHRCESLHGHNYRAGLVVEGGLEPEAWYVLDFVALKRLMKRLTDEWDHKVLLPTRNPKLAVTRRDDAVEVAFDGRVRYRFPERDCVLLPIPNTTVEMLAEHLADRVAAELAQAGARAVRALEIEVEENFGQSAVYRTVLD